MITDYIAAVLHELRSIDFSSLLKEYARFDTSLSERDHLAIRKTFSGFIKLLYPDGNFTQEEAMGIVDFAGESRKRVKEQLYIIDETFRADLPATFEYLRVADARTIKVETLENIENGIVPQPAEPVEEEHDELPENSVEPTPVRVRRPRIGESTQQAVLMPKLIEVRANQKGVSYKSLFGEYLKGATRFDITDPFVRMPHQVDNLIELIHLIREATDNAEGIVITLNTNNNEDKIPEMIDIFDGLKDDLATYGIDFAYRFEADHDRNIVLNNGWTITLGRGLDIFEKFERFSLASSRQSERCCRAFSIAINNSSVE